MTEMMRAFCDHYIMTKNARRSAIAAGYSERSAQNTGSDLLRHPDVKAYLDAAFKERTMSAYECLDLIAEVARLDISDIILENGSIDIPKMKELGLDRFVEEIGFDSNGFPKIKFMSAMAARTLIGKAHKMFGESNQISGPGGGPVDMRILFVRPSDVLPTAPDQTALEAAEHTALASGDGVPEHTTPARDPVNVP
jgi:phage terminase small subunit